MPLRFPDADRTGIEDLQEGVTMLAERAKEWTEEWFAQGQRDMAVQMAVRQARLKFGDKAAERLSPLLDRIADPAALAEVGDGVIQCRDGAELLARAEGRCGLRQRPYEDLIPAWEASRNGVATSPATRALRSR